MKNIRIPVLAILAVLCLHVPARAQDWYTMATWNISVPSGDAKDFISDSSFRGLGLEFRKEFRPATTFGIMGSWEVFHERIDKGSIEIDNATFTGSQDRYINSFPIMVGLHRYFGVEGGTRPYVGLNAGGFVLIQTIRLGLAEVEENTWEWGIMPEAGFAMPIDYGAAFIANVRYSWALTGQDLQGQDAKLTYWGIRVGFAWEHY